MPLRIAIGQFLITLGCRANRPEVTEQRCLKGWTPLQAADFAEWPLAMLIDVTYHDGCSHRGEGRGGIEIKSRLHQLKQL